ncbi:hypothetical protein [Vagococcus sp. WN89Y]|uniref:hypothetical protein n=1 Tax=Vagococcus sp. WN89Y TaxID=3457258 RepID=UPI003FCCFE79
MNLWQHIAGTDLLALIDYCQTVDEQIAGRKLARLKETAQRFREMPKAYYIGVATYFASAITLFYALLLSTLCLAIIQDGGRAFIAGVTVFVLLAIALSGVTKARALSLRLFLSIWSLLCLYHLLMAGWLLFLPFSWLSLGLWTASGLLLWLARQIMNGPELTKLMQWRVSVKIAQFRRLALTQPKHK